MKVPSFAQKQSLTQNLYYMSQVNQSSSKKNQTKNTAGWNQSMNGIADGTDKHPEMTITQIKHKSDKTAGNNLIE